jgi:hypothetical protein
MSRKFAILINWLMQFKEIISVYSQNYIKSTNIKYSVTDCYDNWDA